MKADFNRIIDRRHTGSVKWSRYGDAIPLWVADMDFGAPEPVVEALRERVEHGIFGYTSPPEGLGEAVRAWLRRRHGWEVEQEAISFVPGVMRGVNSVARAMGFWFSRRSTFPSWGCRRTAGGCSSRRPCGR